MHKALSWLAPKKLSDLVWKSGFLCLCVFGWHYVVTRVLRKDSDHVAAEILIEAVATGFPFVLLFMSASWHQVKALNRLTKRAYYDPLSGLLNRQTFIDRFSRRLPDAHCGILLLIDVDHFKAINDKYGHAMGDRCIEAIGHRLHWHLRLDDLAGRIGGEEFAVFLPDVSREHARVVAMRLGLPVAFSDRTNEAHLSVTLSVGAAWVDGERGFEKMLVDADDALYEAKASGRAQLRFCDGTPPMSLATALTEDADAPRRRRRPWSRPGLRSNSRSG